MVRKSSFLEKLKNRWRPASGIRVGGETGEPGNRVSAVAAPASESVSSRKLSSKQEAVVAINEGFRELASLLRGMQTRIDDQGEQIGAAVENLGQLPVLGQAQVELLRSMVERLDRQNSATEDLATRLGDMPTMVADLRESLDKVVATDERTARSLDEFKTNMASIQEAIGRSADATSTLAHAQRDLAEQQTDAVQASLERLEGATEVGVEGMRRAQTEQSQRIGEFVTSNRRSSTAIVVLLSLTLVALIVIAALLGAR